MNAQEEQTYYTQRLQRCREMRDTLSLSPIARKMVMDEIRYLKNRLNNC